MRKTFAAIVLILVAFTGALAFGQSFPLTMPSQTVYGRLGIPGNPGPGQAIPFSTLSTQLLAAGHGGAALMFPHAAQTSVSTDAWTAIDPYGNAISCTNTHSQCLNEFLAAAASNGWNAEVNCSGGIPYSAGPVWNNAGTNIIESTVSINVPVAQDWAFYAHGCTLNISVTTVSGMIVDSNGASHFDWDGIVIYTVTSPNGDVTTNPSCAVYMNPVTNTEDGFASIYDGYFRIKSIAMGVVGNASTGTAGVCMNTNTGGIHNVVEFQEIELTGAGQSQPAAYYGLLAFGTHGIQGSRITIDHPHGMASAGVKLNTVISGGNLWTLNNIEPAGASAKGVWTFTSNDEWRIGTISNADGSFAYGIYSDGASANNYFHFVAISNPGTANWFNNSSGVNYFNGQNSTNGYQAGISEWLAQFVGIGTGAGSSSAFIAQAAQPSYAWDSTAAAANTGWWDCVAGTSNFQCRTVNDAQSSANPWLQVTRSGITISSVQIGNGTTYATIPIGKNDTLTGSAAWAPLAANLGAL